MKISQDRYSAVAIVLHWAIALLILSNIGIAWYFNTLHGMEKIPPVQLHKSIGITVLLLGLARLAWRLAVKPPPLPASMARWEVWAANTVHVLFYVFIIAMPLTGWAMSSASPLIHVFPITLYGVVPWPAIGPLTSLPHDQMRAAHDAFEASHGLLAKLAYVLIVVHVGAALKHVLINRDGVLGRMIPLPFLRAKEPV
jgi:cytochrome b561